MKCNGDLYYEESQTCAAKCMIKDDHSCCFTCGEKKTCLDFCGECEK